MSKEPSYKELMGQPAAGAAGGLVAALLYDGVHALLGLFRRRKAQQRAALLRQRQEARRARKAQRKTVG